MGRFLFLLTFAACISSLLNAAPSIAGENFDRLISILEAPQNLNQIMQSNSQCNPAPLPSAKPSALPSTHLKPPRKVPKKSNIPLFQSQSVLQLTIQGDFPRINTAGAQQGVPLPATLTYQTQEGAAVRMGAHLEARGHGRASWCAFAPMMLVLEPKKEPLEQWKTLRKAKLKGSLFENSQNKIKLLTHCEGSFSPRDGDWQQATLTEYALYQILQASGVPSIETRLAKVDYLSNDGKKFKSGYMVFLENSEDLAQRYDMEVDASVPYEGAVSVPASSKVPYQLGLRLITSEYDHNLTDLKNNILLIPQGTVGKSSLIPYDFLVSGEAFPYTDDSEGYGPNHHNLGWIAEYARQNPTLISEIDQWVKTINSHRVDILVAIEQVPYPENSEYKKRLLRWIREYFADVDAYLATRK